MTKGDKGNEAAFTGRRLRDFLIRFSSPMNGLIQVIFSTRYSLGKFQRDNFKTNKRKKRNASFIRCYSG